MREGNTGKRSRRTRRSGFGTIYTTGTPTNPAFAIRWFEGSRRKKQSGFTRRTDAADALARIRTGLGDGTLVEKRRAGIGFDEVARQWLDLHSKPNLRSHADNEERYRLHVADFFGDCPLAAVTPTRVLELRAQLQTKVIRRTRIDASGKPFVVDTVLAPRTVNLIMALVRSILSFAVVNGHVAASPITRLGRGRLMLPVAKTKLAPPIERAEDVGRLLAAIGDIEREESRPGMHALFATLVYTGIRRGEALGLRWSDLDLNRRIISVRRSYAGLTKSSKHRTVPVAPALAAVLKAHRIADPWKVELVFPDEAGQLFSKQSKLLQDVLEAALIRIEHPRIRVHDLRHTFASHFVMSGGDIFTLQRILGHSTPVITSDTYAHLSPDHMASAADRVAFPEPNEPADVIPFAPLAEAGSARPIRADRTRLGPGTLPVAKRHVAENSRSPE